MIQQASAKKFQRELQKKSSDHYEEIQKLSGDIEIGDNKLHQLEMQQKQLNKLIAICEKPNEDSSLIIGGIEPAAVVPESHYCEEIKLRRP